MRTGARAEKEVGEQYGRLAGEKRRSDRRGSENLRRSTQVRAQALWQISEREQAFQPLASSRNRFQRGLISKQAVPNPRLSDEPLSAIESAEKRVGVDDESVRTAHIRGCFAQNDLLSSEPAIYFVKARFCTETELSTQLSVGPRRLHCENECSFLV
jgi:hypothetical protein